MATLTILGVPHPVKNGTVETPIGLLLVAQDNDFVFTMDHRPFGAIVRGVVLPLNKVPPVQLAALRKKYGF